MSLVALPPFCFSGIEDTVSDHPNRESCHFLTVRGLSNDKASAALRTSDIDALVGRRPERGRSCGVLNPALAHQPRLNMTQGQKNLVSGRVREFWGEEVHVVSTTEVQSLIQRGVRVQILSEVFLAPFPFACGNPPESPDLSEASTVQRGASRQFQLNPSLHPCGGEVLKGTDNQFQSAYP